MSRKTIRTLYAAADAEAARGVLDALRARGFRLTESKGPVLLFLSAAFAADEAAQERFFAAESAGAAVIPVDLDGAAQPELVRGVLIARNAIQARGRSGEEIAERVASAEAFADKGGSKKLGRVLIAAALILALGAGVWIWQGSAEKRAAAVEKRQAAQAAERFGMRPEDLETIESFALIGDQAAFSSFGYVTDSDLNPGGGLLFRLEDYAYETRKDDGRHWYSSEDGHEFRLTRYEDLDFLRFMPQLRSLTLILVEADSLPSLAGLANLEQVHLSDCVIGDYEWLGGAGMFHFTARFCAPADFAPLSRCEALRGADLDFSGVESADLSHFSPPGLRYLTLRGDDSLRTLSLEGLAACELHELEIEKLPVSDLRFLEGQTQLRSLLLKNLGALRDLKPLENARLMMSLYLEDLGALRDISAVGNMGNLHNLNILGCRRLTDFSPIGNCRSLVSFRTMGCYTLRDASFLEGKTLLTEIQLFDCPLEDMSFLWSLRDIAPATLSLEFSGEIRSYAGLAAVKSYRQLHVNPRGNGRYGDLSLVVPYIRDAAVYNLTIHDCTNIDLSALPEVRDHLSIYGGDLRDLTGLQNYPLRGLTLTNMQFLASLDGIENLRAPGTSAKLELEVTGCPRLADWEALRGTKLSKLTLAGLFTMPELEGTGLMSLTLQNMSEVKDLRFLDALGEGHKLYDLKLIACDDLQDLSPLLRLKIDRLAVPPRLQEQAEALTEAGAVDRYEITYTDGGWETEDFELTLTGFDELETMPAALLRHVTRVCLAGDRIVDDDRFEVDDYWDESGNHQILRDRDTDEETELVMGSMEDFSALAQLTGLRELKIFCQPLRSLEGIQNLGSLELLQITACPALEDSSAAVALQGLRDLTFGNCPGVSSLRGVQNLPALRSLGIWGSSVRDLSPLCELDVSAAEREGGFTLSVGVTDCEDYAPVGAIGVFSRLDLNGVDFARWPELGSLRVLRALSAHGDGIDQSVFEQIVAAHGELEELEIPYNGGITDLRALLGMENLRRIVISEDMQDAIESLRGQKPDFELEVWE